MIAISIFRDDFWYEMEQFHRSLRRALRVGEQVVGQMKAQLPEWFKDGPKAEVFDEGKHVRVVLEAPGLSREAKWSHRIEHGHLLLGGRNNVQQTVSSDRGRYYSERRHESFLKWIPLPASVRPKPVSTRYRNGLLELKFEKSRNGRTQERSEWHELHW